MNTIILTSYLDFYYKDEFENRIPKHFGNINNILETIKSHIKKYENFLFITSNEFDYEATDYYSNIAFESFNLTLPFKNYFVLDNRNISEAKNLISNADFIFLSGGHVPTQNKFFNRINLKELLKTTNAVICGGSAGSMNSADVVYSPPELEGESIDPNFEIFYKGLGLTNINILPHFDKYAELILDNKNFIKDIIIPDSYKIKIFAINDGSYFLIENGITNLFGEAYLIYNGKTTKICNENEKIILNINSY